MFDFSFFNGRSYFGNDESQNYLIFEPIANNFIKSTGDTEIFIQRNNQKFQGSTGLRASR